MTSSGRRKKHGLPTEKSTGRGTAPTVAKNMGYRRKKHRRRRKHTLPMQKTWPAVAKNMPSHQDRRKKHPQPLQKTPPTATVAKNTKTSHRRKKHELPTQKTRNPSKQQPHHLRRPKMSATQKKVLLLSRSGNSSRKEIHRMKLMILEMQVWNFCGRVFFLCENV